MPSYVTIGIRQDSKIVCIGEQECIEHGCTQVERICRTQLPCRILVLNRGRYSIKRRIDVQVGDTIVAEHPFGVTHSPDSGVVNLECRQYPDTTPNPTNKQEQQA